MDGNIAYVHPMTTPPTKTGRYVVLHRGMSAADAFYWTPEDVVGLTNCRAGWQQLPSFGPTHWIDTPQVSFGDNIKRFWADSDGFPTIDGNMAPYLHKSLTPIKKKWYHSLMFWKN